MSNKLNSSEYTIGTSHDMTRNEYRRTNKYKDGVLLSKNQTYFQTKTNNTQM